MRFIKRWLLQAFGPFDDGHGRMAPMSIAVGYGGDSGCFMRREFRGRGAARWFWYRRPKRGTGK